LLKCRAAFILNIPAAGRRLCRAAARNIRMQEDKEGPKMAGEEKYMKAAIREAVKARALGEVPIGCVIVYEDKIIGRGYNRRMVDRNVLAHAELTAIRKACRKMGDWRLEGCTMYVTLEPCPMCAGAIVQARIPEIRIGSMNPKAGCAGSVLNLLQEKGFNHQVRVETGILGEECSQMLSEFFKELRKKKKEGAAVQIS
jgi:tRNA(adenine34) deaminase